jgi:glycine cleavage system H protein
MEIHQDCRYTETHEWARKEGDEILVGITDFAQNELGDVVYVELPDADEALKAGDEAGMIDSAKTTSPIVNPIGGTVAKVNDELEAHPELINQSPYDEGWIYSIRPDSPADFDKLMDPAAYAEFVKQAEKH